MGIFVLSARLYNNPTISVLFVVMKHKKNKEIVSIKDYSLGKVSKSFGLWINRRSEVTRW